MTKMVKIVQIIVFYSTFFNTSPWITFLKVNVFVIFHSALCMIAFKLGDPSGGADTCKGTEWGSVHIDHLSDSNSDSD